MNKLFDVLWMRFCVLTQGSVFGAYNLHFADRSVPIKPLISKDNARALATLKGSSNAHSSRWAHRTDDAEKLIGIHAQAAGLKSRLKHQD